MSGKRGSITRFYKPREMKGLTKNFAIFIVDVYEFNSGSRNMVFREIERIALEWAQTFDL